MHIAIKGYLIEIKSITILGMMVLACRRLNNSPCGLSMTVELVPEGGQQISLFDDAVGDTKTSNLMTTMDNINMRYAKGTIKLASEGTKKAWAMRRGFKSPNYTGDWKELPTIG